MKQGYLPAVSLIALTVLGLSLSACNSSPTRSEAGDVLVKQDTTSEAQLLEGQQLFAVCQACHNIAQGAEHKVGPNLWGIIDQPAGSQQGYEYSEPLKNSGLVWNKATMTGWVAATETLVPGTWMTYHNHLTAQENMRLVEYIAKQK